MEAKDRLIFALDVLDIERAISLLDQLEGRVGLVKVNSLAVAYPEIISIIQDRKIEVWRDFKHHDIPGTVANFIKADVKDGLVMTTVHALGGKKMMEYAVDNDVIKAAAIKIPVKFQYVAKDKISPQIFSGVAYVPGIVVNTHIVAAGIIFFKQSRTAS